MSDWIHNTVFFYFFLVNFGSINLVRLLSPPCVASLQLQILRVSSGHMPHGIMS